MSGDKPSAEPPWVDELFEPATIRRRCQQLFDRCAAGHSEYFDFNQANLEPAAQVVCQEINQRYPDLEIPFHGRWRHFLPKELDDLKESLPIGSKRLLALADLTLISVLLDAGAGDRWCYRRHGQTYTRSEGLAIAGFDMFKAGLFSQSTSDPCRVDAQTLLGLQESDLKRGFQVDDANPLAGLSGRTQLLNNLGQAILDKKALFAEVDRPGGLLLPYEGKKIDAAQLFALIMAGLNDIWPSRVKVGQRSLGDVWVHPGIVGSEEQDRFVPFHKLSQWLCYSLLEVLVDGGSQVHGLERLTGLPEYRNGGLFIDSGVLSVKSIDPSQPLAVDHAAIVEWRALTVILLDRVASLVRKHFSRDEYSWPLVKVLEGGTWHAGRRLAQQLRQGQPPLAIISDGTVF